MEQQRVVCTNDGQIVYTLIRKRIKNLNLRLNDAGEVILSIPMRCTLAQADDFVVRKSGWIKTHLLHRRQREACILLPELSRKECYELLYQAMEQVYPLVQPLGVSKPQLKIRSMRSQWGNCHWAQGYMTLNTALHRCPEHLRHYVALHELVHFLHHDHSPAFYGVLDALMPDWRARRKELKGYISAIRN